MGRETHIIADALARLCEYYTDCIIREGRGSVEAPLDSSPHRRRCAELSAVPRPEDGPHAVFASRAAEMLLETARREPLGTALVVGWPVLLAMTKDAAGRDVPAAVPLLLFAIEPSAASGLPSLSDEPPHLNYRAVELLTREPRESAVCELVELSRELGLSESAGWPDLVELARRLPVLRPHWPWRQPPQPAATGPLPPLTQAGGSGLFNTALLILSEQPPYTRNLLTELAELRRAIPAACERSALGDWLAGEFAPAGPPAAEETLLEPLPLNDEQRAAVLRGLHAPLTVITGPPGTGKSQVVMALLINAAWRGMTVLLASRNNQAVDVVEQRVNALGANRLLMRLGTRQHNDALSAYLSSLLGTAAPPDAQHRYDSATAAIAQLQRNRQGLARELSRTVNLRNEVERLAQDIEPLRRWWGEESFAALRDFDVAGAEAAAGALSGAVDRADRRRRPLHERLMWSYLGPRRAAQAARAAVAAADVARRLGVKLPQDAPADATMEQWRLACDELRARLKPARAVREYFDRLHALTVAMSPEQAAAQYIQIARQMAGASSEAWRAWLDMLPARLDGRRRQDLARYVSTVGARQTRNLHECFAGASAALPAWAITSLSASGRVPLSAGLFDLLIIDEASQCDIPSALPLLYRARRAVIIGDPNQLRHITSLDARTDDELFTRCRLPQDRRAWMYCRNSLFDLAAGLCGQDAVIVLRDHHRSHADIVGFSNARFYRCQLRIATRYERLRPPPGDGRAVRWVDVRGRVERPEGGGAVNAAEARAVVAELRKLVVDGGYGGEVGVVTPFRAQQQLINAIVDADRELASRLPALRFAAATAHSFQGDERDVMIFSPVVSEGMPDGAARFLLATPNIFNVAITRARSALIVVGDLGAAIASGIPHLSAFARHVQALSAGPAGTPAPGAVRDTAYPPVSRPELVTEWHRRLYDALVRAGICPVAQHHVEQYVLDFAIIDGNRKLAIDLDAAMHGRLWDDEYARRDQLRTQRLLELGWTPMRFWICQVRDDLDRCVARVRRCIGAA